MSRTLEATVPDGVIFGCKAFGPFNTRREQADGQGFLIIIHIYLTPFNRIRSSSHPHFPQCPIISASEIMTRTAKETAKHPLQDTQNTHTNIGGDTRSRSARAAPLGAASPASRPRSRATASGRDRTGRRPARRADRQAQAGRLQATPHGATRQRQPSAAAPI